MRNLLVAAVAAASALTPLSAPATFAQGWHDDHHGDLRDGHPGDVHGDRDWRHDRSDWRDERREDRWDAQRHNGYWWHDRWYFGPPPARYYGRPGFFLGYHPWARGGVLPRYYFDRRYYIDYRDYRLRPPPRGYHYVRDDRGEFLLVGIATGVILGSILSDRY